MLIGLMGEEELQLKTRQIDSNGLRGWARKQKTVEYWEVVLCQDRLLETYSQQASIIKPDSLRTRTKTQGTILSGKGKTQIRHRTNNEGWNVKKVPKSIWVQNEPSNKRARKKNYRTKGTVKASHGFFVKKEERNRTEGQRTVLKIIWIDPKVLT